MGTIPIPFSHNLFNKQVEVIITPAPKHRTTKERLMEFFEQTSDAIPSGSSTEISWGKPVGKEVW
jgi:antitoxin component of MazEF toxin-antitoxin module